MSDERRFAPATARNRDPIAEVLGDYLPETGDVLEIASGSGEHGVHLARRFAGLRFQPSDPDPEARASIAAWRTHEALPNLAEPIEIDVTRAEWWAKRESVDALLCINMIHISPWSATEGLMRGAGRLLRPGGWLYLYGPYKRDGVHTAESNAAFDRSLRARNPAYGVRDLEAVQALGRAEGLEPETPIPMPANNLSVLFQRAGAPD